MNQIDAKVTDGISNYLKIWWTDGKFNTINKKSLVSVGLRI